MSARKCQRRRDGSLTPSQIDYVEISKLDQTRQTSNEPEAHGATRRRTAKTMRVGAPAALEKKDCADRVPQPRNEEESEPASAGVQRLRWNMLREIVQLRDMQQRDDTRTITGADRWLQSRSGHRYCSRQRPGVKRIDGTTARGRCAKVRHGPAARAPTVSGANGRARFVDGDHGAGAFLGAPGRAQPGRTTTRGTRIGVIRRSCGAAVRAPSHALESNHRASWQRPRRHLARA
jgi:hypothetical protein